MPPELHNRRFPSCVRNGRESLEGQRNLLASEPLIVNLLESFPEPAMILNRDREIVLANDRTRELLGCDDGYLLGLRPGDALNCVHQNEEPGGCGKSRACEHCGANRALSNCAQNHAPDIQECRIEARIGGEIRALDLRICVTPFPFSGQDFLVTSMRDIAHEKRRMVLERTFFHDIMNSAGGLQGLIDILGCCERNEEAEIRQLASDLCSQLIEEIESQRQLLAAEQGTLRAMLSWGDAAAILGRICRIYGRQALGSDKRLIINGMTGSTRIWTDTVLLGRVIGNLIKNALEASNRYDTVQVGYRNSVAPIFWVRNPAIMSEAVQLQLFHRSFTTKEGQGRGIGCYSVKLLTEKYLRGRVEFTSEAPAGTTFYVTLPASDDPSTMDAEVRSAVDSEAQCP